MTRDCLDASGDATARRVVTACERAWPDNKSDCNRFLKAVAAELGLRVLDPNWNADDIIDQMTRDGSGWTALARGDAEAARQHACAGFFVVAGLRSTEMNRQNGHVAIVTCGALVRSAADARDYPRGYWGTLDAVGDRCQGLNFAFPSAARLHIRYYAREVT